MPKDDAKHEDDWATGMVYDIEAGLNYKLFKKIGLYGTAKYISAHKKKDGINLIDLSVSQIRGDVTLIKINKKG